ncbi:hypothetical protein GN956_G13320 [Arapaima gigas]
MQIWRWIWHEGEQAFALADQLRDRRSRPAGKRARRTQTGVTQKDFFLASSSDTRPAGYENIPEGTERARTHTWQNEAA